jgi:serralysin
VTVTASTANGIGGITYAIDDVVPISAGDGCAYPHGTDHAEVTCSIATLDSRDPYATVKLTLGDGNDAVTYDNATTTSRWAWPGW